jgi:hypothetical protein
MIEIGSEMTMHICASCERESLEWYGQNTENNISYDRATITVAASFTSVLCEKLTSMPISSGGCTLVLRAWSGTGLVALCSCGWSDSR